MSSDGIYSTMKILQHPDALARMARRESQPAPIMIDFMPALACNQSCAFCAYGHRKPEDPPDRAGWKNMPLMSDAFMPVEKMRECIASWAGMGVRAIELTGGGEPLIYPHVDELLRLMAATGMELGLVTNGTALTDERAELLAAVPGWRWARVSIDAGSEADYCRTRRVPASHWVLAWRAVERLAVHRFTSWSQVRVGVGFVVDNTNATGVYEAARLAREAGADNIRIALTFSPRGLRLFEPGVIDEARAQAVAAARDFGGTSPAGAEDGKSPRFRVHDLINERAANLVSMVQDYDYCGMKEFRCVVSGDENVYTCCSLAFNPKGLLGSIRERSFRALWEDSAGFRRGHNARMICTNECLYETRNKAINEMIEGVRAPHGMFV